MLLDATLVLSDKQALTASAASEHTIDQTAAANAHNHLTVVAQTNEDFAGLTSLKISLQTDEQSTFSNPKELLSATFEAADLKAGKTLFKTVLPAGALRYIRAYYTLSGSASAGKLSLFITDLADM